MDHTVAGSRPLPIARASRRGSSSPAGPEGESTCGIRASIHTVPTPEQLDYALVRLERPLGREPLDTNPKSGATIPLRGWVRVPASDPTITPRMPILILQHARTESLKLALDTEGVTQVNVNGTRVRYATNTESGSSGSPCFDLNWGLVALHHYGDPEEHHPPEWNQGVPISMIRERLRRAGQASVLGGDPP